MAGGEPRRVEQHAQLPSSSADNRGFCDLLRLLYRVVNLSDQTAEGEMVVAWAVERQCKDRHVVDRLWLDERGTHSGRYSIVVRAELLGESYQAALDVFADKETDDQLALARARGGVDVLHARNFPK